MGAALTESRRADMDRRASPHGSGAAQGASGILAPHVGAAPVCASLRRSGGETGLMAHSLFDRAPPTDAWHRQVLALENGLLPGHAGLHPSPARDLGRRGMSSVGGRNLIFLWTAGLTLVLAASCA